MCRVPLLPAPAAPVSFLQDDVAGCFDYYADLAEKLDARQYSAIDVGMEEFSVKVRREPLGVVGLITPWNYPLLMATVRAAVLEGDGSFPNLATFGLATSGWRLEIASCGDESLSVCPRLFQLSCKLHRCNHTAQLAAVTSHLGSAPMRAPFAQSCSCLPAALPPAVEGGACAGCRQLLRAEAQ
eukprot:GHRQ01020168.1.p1 GENE.GHRQ01020168.1~~GHRQ01020168.1.p1  ORF type:complete len:184 (-),score=44.05 GHRQ01020168.1:481-1032(-)